VGDSKVVAMNESASSSSPTPNRTLKRATYFGAAITGAPSVPPQKR
jgi:hypothetical protein